MREGMRRTVRTVKALALRKKVVEFVSAAHRMAREGLLSCASGNLSWRVTSDWMLITGTGTWLGRLTADEVAVCETKGGTLVKGCQPSKEVGFHAGILAERNDVDVVLHFQSPHATTLACCRPRERNYFVIPEVPYYLGEIASVPYLPPGSRELADAVVAASRTHDLVVLRNHGQVTVGRSFDDVFQNASVFELACRIMLQAGTSLGTLPQREATGLVAEGSRARSKRG